MLLVPWYLVLGCPCLSLPPPEQLEPSNEVMLSAPSSYAQGPRVTAPTPTYCLRSGPLSHLANEKINTERLLCPDYPARTGLGVEQAGGSGLGLGVPTHSF